MIARAANFKTFVSRSLLFTLLGSASAFAQGALKPMAQDADPSFEVATIKPNNSGIPMMTGLKQHGRQFATTNTSLVDLISFAYVMQKKQIVSGPEWMDKERFDLNAETNGEGEPNTTQWRIMVQKLLAERFGLKFHSGQVELPAFVLTAVKPEQLPVTELKGSFPVNDLEPATGGWTLTMKNASARAFTAYLQMVILDRPVVDQTGLTGHYDFKVTFLPDESQFKGRPPPTKHEDNGTMAPGLFDAVREQLGLKLESKKTMVETVVIDHVEHASEN